MSPRHFFLISSAVGASALLAPHAALGATYRGAAGASWFVASNWNPTGIPTASTTIVVNTNRSVVVSSTGALGSQVTLGSTNANSTGTLTVQGGGQGTSNGTFSVNRGSLFKVTGANSQWTVNGRMAVQATPEVPTSPGPNVLISDGGKLVVNAGTDNSYFDYRATLTVTGAGSTFNHNGYLTLYTGAFNFLDHAIVNTGEFDSAWFEDNIATINVSGGAQWTLPGMAIGNTFITMATGHTELNLTDGGSITATGSNGGGIYVGNFGRVNVGTGGLAGSIQAPEINLVQAGSTLAFNHTDNVTVDAPIGGVGTVIKEGAGVTTLSGVSSYTGDTLVKGGILHVTGDISSSVTTVELSGTLSGDGNVGTVNLEGTLSPGASFTAGSTGIMTVGGGSTLDGIVKLEIGGVIRGGEYDALNVSGLGLVTITGDLQLSFLNGFVPGPGDTFQLFDGAFIGNFAHINLPTLGGTLDWDTSQLGATGVISVVPEPGSCTLLLGGVAFPLLRRRRKERVSLR